MFEKEADKYADEHAFRVPYDGSNNLYDDVDFKASKEGYLAGANPREKRIAELEKQIVDLKDYILQVSKFLHNNNNTRPDKLAYKERDVLLIKELKLFEKWELSK